MGWLIAAAVIVLLALLPLGIDAKYSDAGAQLWVVAGPLRLKLLSGSKKKAKKEKPKQEKTQKESGGGKASGKDQGGGVSDFLPLVRVVVDFLQDFRQKLRVNVLELKITMAGEDPCDLAVNYGRACAAVANLDPQLERFFIIKKKDVQVQCDFEGNKTRIKARLYLTITLGRLLGQLLRHGSRAAKEIFKIMKLRKGGALQ